MKFLVDNQLPPALARWLVSHEQEALHVLDAGLAEAKDEEIWEYASANSLVLITKDERTFQGRPPHGKAAFASFGCA